MTKPKPKTISPVDYLIKELQECGMLKVRSPFNLAIYKKAKQMENDLRSNEIKNTFLND